MSFSLNASLNGRTAFLARFSELKDRFDPEMVLFRRKTHDFKYPPKKLRSFFSEPPQYGAGERGIERTSDSQPRYVRITDIDEYGILNGELGATAENFDNRYILREDDILLARSGNTVGKAYIHKSAHAPVSCFFAGYLIRFRFNVTEILPDYIFAFTQLPYYKKWVAATQRAAGQPNINVKEYSSLDVPSAPFKIQERVVGLLDAAYTTKRNREQEARGLLESIDKFFLDELGIVLDPEPENTIETRIFQRAFSSLTGNRIDPAANWKQFLFKSHKYELKRLPEIAFINPATSFSKLESNAPISFVPMEAVSDVYGEIADSQTRLAGDFGSYTCFQNGDVLWAKITPCMENGKSAVARELEEGFGYGSTEFHVFRPRNKDLSPMFLHYVLRLRHVRRHARLHFTGSSGHQRVDERFFYRMAIPYPSRKEQDRIAEKADSIKEKARGLIKDAAAELDKAKQEIEAFILGRGTGNEA